MKDEKAIRGKSGIITVDTNKTGVRFRNSQLETLNKEYQGLMEGYESKQEEIVKEIMEIVCGYSENFSQLGAIVSRLGMVTTQHFFTEFTIACSTYLKCYLLPSKRRKSSHNSPIYNECQTQSAGVWALP